MHEDMRNLLNAYLDGELYGSRLLEIKHHLTVCTSCRETLKELRLVSEILQADPLPAFLPAEQFAANLLLRLPHRPLHAQPPKPGSTAWWLVPAVLLGGWAFVQAILLLTNWVTAANLLGLLGEDFWLKTGAGIFWLEWAKGLFSSGQMQATLTFLSQLGSLGRGIWQSLLWQAALVILYWFWLTLWWQKRGPRPMRSRFASAQG